MDLAGAIKQVSEFDAKFRELTRDLACATAEQPENDGGIQVYRKGMSEQIDEANGTITDFD